MLARSFLRTTSRRTTSYSILKRPSGTPTAFQHAAKRAVYGTPNMPMYASGVTLLGAITALALTKEDVEEEEMQVLGTSSIENTLKDLKIDVKGIKNMFTIPNDQALQNIMLFNASVFGMWKIAARNPKVATIMQKHFTCAPGNLLRTHYYHTLVTSTISHAKITHLAINMFALMTIVPFVRGWGGMSDNALYLTYTACGAGGTGIATVVRKFGLKSGSGLTTMGASGAIMGLFTIFALMNPKKQLDLKVTPTRISAQAALVGVTAMNLVAFKLHRGRMDHLAHLSGQSVGLIYCLKEGKIRL